ncbi:unnamed protein product, partial [Brassica rapa]
TQNPSRLLLAVNLISILHRYQPVVPVPVPVAPLSLILCFAFVYLASLFSFSCQYVCLLCYLDVSFRCIGGIRKVLEWQLSPICQLLCVCGSWNQR